MYIMIKFYICSKMDEPRGYYAEEINDKRYTFNISLISDILQDETKLMNQLKQKNEHSDYKLIILAVWGTRGCHSDRSQWYSSR